MTSFISSPFLATSAEIKTSTWLSANCFSTSSRSLIASSYHRHKWLWNGLESNSSRNRWPIFWWRKKTRSHEVCFFKPTKQTVQDFGQFILEPGAFNNLSCLLVWIQSFGTDVNFRATFLKYAPIWDAESAQWYWTYVSVS